MQWLVMDFKRLSAKIDRNSSLPIHNYYQKILSLLFINGKDPFNRQLLSIDCEKRIEKGVADIYLKWRYNNKVFTEIVEVELQGKKKTIQNKIKLYRDSADFLSFCVPSQRVPPMVKIFPKMKKDLGKINLLYIIDSNIVTKNRRRIVDDKDFVVSAHSPFLLLDCPDGDMSCVKEVANRHRSLLFDAMVHQKFMQQPLQPQVRI
jgi:hypothetical protein